MKLYSYWRSTAAYRVRIALNLKEIEYELIPVHLVRDGGQQHHDDYQSINPQSLVPALQMPDGKVLTQSLAIIDYLDAKVADKPLYPSDAIAQAQSRAMALSIACDIHPLNNLRVLKYLKGQENWQQSQVDQWYAHWIHEGFAAIEKQLAFSARQYCFADAISVADIFVVAQVYNANRFKVDLGAYPLIRKINHNCLQQQAFIDAMPENQIDCDI